VCVCVNFIIMYYGKQTNVSSKQQNITVIKYYQNRMRMFIVIIRQHVRTQYVWVNFVS